MFTSRQIHGGTGFLISSVLIPILVGVILGAIEALIIVFVVCFAAWVLTHESVRPKIRESSVALAKWGQRRSMMSLLCLALFGGIFGFVLFGGAWLYGLYLHKKAPLVLDSAATAKYERAISGGKAPNPPPIANPLNAETHGTSDKPSSKPHSMPPTQPTIIQTQAPYGNLAKRCNALGNEIILFVEQRNKERPDQITRQEEYKDWFRRNDGMFRWYFYDHVAKSHQEMSGLHIAARVNDFETHASGVY